jgi:hypothetical protein
MVIDPKEIDNIQKLAIKIVLPPLLFSFINTLYFSHPFIYIYINKIPQKQYKIWKREDFELGTLLGEGPCSWIYSAREKQTKFIVALKFIDKKVIVKNGLKKQLVQEVENQKQIK